MNVATTLIFMEEIITFVDLMATVSTQLEVASVHAILDMSFSVTARVEDATVWKTVIH